jgi:hypothetical protein
MIVRYCIDDPRHPTLRPELQAPWRWLAYVFAYTLPIYERWEAIRVIDTVDGCVLVDRILEHRT